MTSLQSIVFLGIQIIVLFQCFNFIESNHNRITTNDVVQLPSEKQINLKLEYEWKELEYRFPSEKEKQYAIEQGQLVEGAGTPIDVDVQTKNRKKRRVFVSVPRFGTGVPFSLGEIIDAKTHNGHYIEAYPGYFLWHKNTHNGKHCDGITSVFRIEIDQCNRLWIVDTGKIGDIQYCPPQLLIFDLRTDKLFHRYKFPPNTYKPASLFITPIIDTRDPPPLGNCLNTKVYISDVTGYGLVVYDSLTDDSWRVEHDTMKNDVRYDNFTILGESFMLQDGIFGMAVTPLSPQHPRRLLFYHGLANNQEIAVPLNVLDNKALWRNPKSNSQAFQVVGSRDQQASAQAIDSRGNIYFGLVSSTAIGSWNYQTPWNGNSSAIITNPQTLQFTSGLKVVKNKQNKEELWISTNRFQKIMAGTLDNNEINFRIQKALVNDLVCN